MIHYHGGRHSTWRVAVEVWRRRHALVSFADPQQISIASDVAQSFALDIGPFTSWKQSLEIDWRSYYDWVEEWLHHPGFDWAVIPNVTEDQAEANDALIAEWPFGRFAGVPVWHFHESLDRLKRLAGEWPRVALGSSGQHAEIGTGKWWIRMQQIMETVCQDGRPITRLHGLGMLRPSISSHIPLASADSAGVSGGVGTYRHASDPVKAQVLLEAYESAPAAAAWAGIPEHAELFP